mmetsp:Transcript_12566/g.35303  ORF Transcript_12566/g.35303 Transcript_12566/m.35303 type:complete len:1051 (+) Transcript_12566:314-3466(+)
MEKPATSDDVEAGLAGDGSTSSKKSASKRPRLEKARKFLGDARTDRSWRGALAIMTPLALLLFIPGNDRLLRAVMGGIPGSLYTILVFFYAPSIGAAFSRSLCYMWSVILSLPFLMLYAYLAAAFGKVAIFSAVVLTWALLGPFYGGLIPIVFAATTVGFVMGPLNSLTPADAANPGAFAVSLWAPDGPLTAAALSAGLVIPFTVAPYLLWNLPLSSRDIFSGAVEVMDEVAREVSAIAGLMRPGHTTTMEEDKILAHEVRERVKRIAGIIEFMKTSLPFTRFEPGTFPAGNRRIPIKKWAALHHAVRKMSIKTSLILGALTHALTLRAEAGGKHPYKPVQTDWQDDAADVLESYMLGVKNIANALRPFQHRVYRHVDELVKTSLNLISESFKGLKEKKVTLLASVEKANIAGLPECCEKLSAWAGATTAAPSEEALDVLAREILQEGRQGNESLGMARIDRMTLEELYYRYQLMVVVACGTTLETQDALKTASADVVSMISTPMSVSCCLWESFQGIMDTPWTVVDSYVETFALMRGGRLQTFLHGHPGKYLQMLVGFSTLLAMNIFWPAWRNLVGHSGFSAYHIVAFVTTLSDSFESTLKKGLSCLIGIPIGGLFGVQFIVLRELLTPYSTALDFAFIACIICMVLMSAVVLWFQPTPVSQFKLPRMADLSIALQQGGATAVAIVIAGLDISITNRIHAAASTYISKTVSIMVAALVAVVTSLLVYPSFNYSIVRRKLRKVLRDAAIHYQQLGMIFYEPTRNAADPVSAQSILKMPTSRFGRLVRAQTLLSSVKLEPVKPLEVISSIESNMEFLRDQLFEIEATLAGTDSYGSSFMTCISFTSDRGAHQAMDITQKLVLVYLKNLAHMMMAAHAELGYDDTVVMSYHHYQSGISQFQPHLCPYSEELQALQEEFSKESRLFVNLQAKALLTVSALLLYHSPNFADLVSFTHETPEEVKQHTRTLEQLIPELSAALTRTRTKRFSLYLKWILLANRQAKAPKQGFSPPSKAEVEARLGEVVRAMGDDSVFSSFGSGVHRLLLQAFSSFP